MEFFSDILRPGQDFVKLIILGDIPQEPGYESDEGIWDMRVSPVHINFCINRNTSFAIFQEDVVQFPLIRYHLMKHNPELAGALFVEDDKIYPPELDASYDEECQTIHPERFQKRGDHAYDNGPGRGWWSAVFDISSNHDASAHVNWRVIDSQEDWESLMRVLHVAKGKRVAYLRHLSVKERILFVQEQVDKEKEYMAQHDDWKPLNFLLKRHRDEQKAAGMNSGRGTRSINARLLSADNGLSLLDRTQAVTDGSIVDGWYSFKNFST